MFPEEKKKWKKGTFVYLSPVKECPHYFYFTPFRSFISKRIPQKREESKLIVIDYFDIVFFFLFFLSKTIYIFLYSNKYVNRYILTLNILKIIYYMKACVFWNIFADKYLTFLPRFVQHKLFNQNKDNLQITF